MNFLKNKGWNVFNLTSGSQQRGIPLYPFLPFSLSYVSNITVLPFCLPNLTVSGKKIQHEMRNKSTKPMFSRVGGVAVSDRSISITCYIAMSRLTDIKHLCHIKNET